MEAPSSPTLLAELIHPDDPRFPSLLDLRWRVLRHPWHQPRGSERDEYDGPHRTLVAHAGVMVDGFVAAVGRIHRLDLGLAQVRYMAVDPEHRGKGLGKLVLHRLEDEARTWGSVTIIMNAREDALGFYRSAGYEDAGPGPTLFDRIRHRRLIKHL
mgnify:CR=1 FL=1